MLLGKKDLIFVLVDFKLDTYHYAQMYNKYELDNFLKMACCARHVVSYVGFI